MSKIINVEFNVETVFTSTEEKVREIIKEIAEIEGLNSLEVNIDE